MIWSPKERGWERDLGRVGWLEVVSVAGSWSLLWVNHGTETELSTHDTEAQALQAGYEWADVVRTQIGNVLAQQANPQDDGE